MSSKGKNCKNIEIISPLTGQAVALEQVPDPVFSQKIIGDGMAVIPENGKIVSPVDGEIVSIADTCHAFGFRSAEGVEMLVHVGLETVALKGECFKVHAKVGDQVKKGDLVAEADLAFLKERNINPITPVLVCGGIEGKQMKGQEGAVKAGTGVLISIAEEQAEAAVQAAEVKAEPKAAPAAEAPKKKGINFCTSTPAI